LRISVIITVLVSAKSLFPVLRSAEMRNLSDAAADCIYVFVHCVSTKSYLQCWKLARWGL